MKLVRLLSTRMLLLYGVLIAGGIVFSFPFLWMVGTSFKVQREMAVENLRIFPQLPRPQQETPYIDPHEFDPPVRPEGVPEAVWATTAPRLERRLLDVIDRWQPRAMTVENVIDRSKLDVDLYRREMLEGLFHVLGERISDTARRSAVQAERERRLARGEDPASLYDRRLAGELAAESLNAGVEAILAEADKLVDEPTLRETFDRCYRRFCLGKCDVRTSDYRMHAYASGAEWTVESGSAELLQRREPGSRFREVNADFSGEQSRVVFRLEKATDIPVDKIDRIHISHRDDEAWGRLVYEVIRNGQLYRAEEHVNLADRRWRDVQLRWPEGAGDPMELRMYYFLRHVGAAPAGSPAFAIRAIVSRNTLAGACWDKLLRNYRKVFREMPFGRYIMTSLALSILNIVLMVFSCTLTAYAFARLRWPGRSLCFGIMLATMMIPPQVTMIPSFLIFKNLGWYNTLLPLWALACFGSPFFIFLLRQFFKTIPQDLEDSARIDGCGFLRIYWHIMLPLVTPTIAIIAIYTFIGVWNNFMGPLIYVNDERLFPLALGLFKYRLTDTAMNDIGLLMAASFVMTLPIIVLFFFVQRYFIQGITLTGMKA